MLRTKHIFTVIFALLGVALVVVGAQRGIWPLSVQFIGGLLFIGYAVARWRIL